MMTFFALKAALVWVMSVLGNTSWSNFVFVKQVLQSVVLQIKDENSQFSYHVGIDWLVALVAIAGSILALVASDRVVHRLKNKDKDTTFDWRNDYK